jgi:hypothetical protein
MLYLVQITTSLIIRLVNKQHLREIFSVEKRRI